MERIWRCLRLKMALKHWSIPHRSPFRRHCGYVCAPRSRALFLNVPDTAILTRDYSAWIGLVCRKSLTRWRVPPSKVIIGAHGQTVWHAPKRGISVQLLDPTIVAFQTGCTVMAGFRQPDLARGGEGAPLVPFYHWIRANSGGFAKTLPFAIHNIGGIANLTYITRDKHRIVAFDTGPGNALIDLAAEKATNGRQKFDTGGKLAASKIKSIDWHAIEKLGRHAFFRALPPRVRVASCSVGPS